MNYYQARERKDGGGWHFTCMNDGRIWPVGYCRDHEPHETKEAAEVCYLDYLLDHKLRFVEESPVDGYTSAPSWPCIECSSPTHKTARFRGEGPMPVCDEHANRDTIAKHVQAPTQITSSY